MHGRPVDILRSPLKLDLSIEKDEYRDCDTEYFLSNAQERRMRGFFEWLDKLESHVLPHVICFQEVIWVPMIDICVKELNKRGYVSHTNISLDHDKGSPTSFPAPKMGSGLGIYVQRSAGLNVIDGGRQVFDHRLGADWICDKGFKWALISIRNPNLCALTKGEAYIVVLTTHPQAYNELHHYSPAGEGFWTRMMRKIARFDFDLRGGFPWAIVKAHKNQYHQIANHINQVIIPRVQDKIGCKTVLRGLFVAGDFNVNRYATQPETAAESDPFRAFTAEESREFVAVRTTLGCSSAPTILQEPDVRLRPKHGGKFTWDGTDNSLAKPMVSSAPPAFAWIDSILACAQKLVLPVKYLDNRSIAMRLPTPIPEVAPFWRLPCYRWRQYQEEYRSINREIIRRMRQGIGQYRYLANIYRKFNNRQSWTRFVQSAPYELSSQLWKGVDFYKLRTDDLHINKHTIHLKIGDPHPFRMIADVTDHHAVLARIKLQ
jgi:hypothetical protein